MCWVVMFNQLVPEMLMRLCMASRWGGSFFTRWISLSSGSPAFSGEIIEYTTEINRQ